MGLFRFGFPEIIYVVAALVVAFTLHELSHGLMAYWLGDKTAKYDGRLTLNPIRHIDPIGFLMILFVGFGWAKPVMVNPANFKYPKQDMALTAVAGPMSNFILAFVSVMILYPLMIYGGRNEAVLIVVRFLQYFIQFNVLLGIFNLLPLPPLDGSKLFSVILPDRAYFNFIDFGSRFGMIILLVLVVTGALGQIIGPVMRFVIEMLHAVAMAIYF